MTGMGNAKRGLVLAATLLSSAAFGDPASMPLLDEPGLRLYTQKAYESFDPAINAAVDARYEELIAAGMDTARHLFDWRDLEPGPGQYDIQLVREAMDALKTRGIEYQFANLVVLDSAGPVVPDYIEDLLAGGARWDDPRIIEPFAELLDVFIPIMLERGLFMLGLSNEPGGYYEDEPALAATFKGFIEAAVERAHLLEPDLAATVVFAGPTDPAIPDLMPLSDVASFNYYFYRPEPDPGCLIDGSPAALYVSDVAANVATYLDELIEAADGRLVNIQEIGQTSAGASTGPATSEANQAAVYAALVSALQARRSHIRTVCNWTLNDHREAWLPLADALVGEGLPRCLADNFVDIFTETGLVRSDAAASPKPAFDIFKNAIAPLAGFSINEGIAGAWFNPPTSGQGFFIDVDTKNGLVFVSWSTFVSNGEDGTGAGGQRWYTAFGRFEGNAARDLALLQTTGGLLNAGVPVVTVEVGRIGIEFADCAAGQVSFSFHDGGPSGVVSLERLLPDSAVLCERLAGLRSDPVDGEAFPLAQ